jgi:hypothetical protein
MVLTRFLILQRHFVVASNVLSEFVQIAVVYRSSNRSERAEIMKHGPFAQETSADGLSEIVLDGLLLTSAAASTAYWIVLLLQVAFNAIRGLRFNAI